MLDKQVLSGWAISLSLNWLSLLLIDNERGGQEIGRSHRVECVLCIKTMAGRTFFFPFLIPECKVDNIIDLSSTGEKDSQSLSVILILRLCSILDL